MTTLLTVRDLRVSFGAIHAVRGIDLTIEAGRAAAIVGTNGAGKSSTLLALAGSVPASARSSGTIEVTGSTKISMVPERDKIFSLLTVAENMTAADRERSRGRVGIDDVYGWFPRLAERRASLGGNLSGGEQQMLAIGMALLGSPALLLLDEPTLGLAVPIIEQLCEMLARLRSDLNLTVLCAEADVHWVDKLAESAVVLVRGNIVETLFDDLAAQRSRVRDLALGLAVTEQAS
jgi:branched-chain amino acid transport system ATP-binding protein